MEFKKCERCGCFFVSNDDICGIMFCLFDLNFTCLGVFFCDITHKLFFINFNLFI